ncbi:MAG: sigma-54 dependent transcriptional regulator [Gammaproteobacteria bacterium]
MQRNVLIVEDEANMRMVMQMALEQVGFQVKTADSGDAAVELLADPELDVILTDLKMPGMSGHEFIRISQQQRYDVPIIVVTAFGSIRSAIECIQAGASNYLTKPFEPEALQFAVENALRYRDLLHENHQLHTVLQELLPPPRMLGDSPVMQDLRDRIRKLALRSSPVLITGEHGTGKLTLAHAIHASGPRAQMPFVVFNCRTVASDKVEPILFGDLGSDFATDKTYRLGKLAQADGGTLYLNEIDALAPDVQRRLKQVVEEGWYMPVGGNTRQRVNVRFLAAANNDLSENLETKQFDTELYQVLSASCLKTVPLRERAEDIAMLAQDFIQELSEQAAIPVSSISAAALDALTQYDWPDNVRELRHSMEHALLESRGETIEPSHLPMRILAADARPLGINLDMLPSGGLDTWLDEAERTLIIQALDACDGVQVNAARMLGINERSLWHRLKKLDIQVNKKVTK